MNRNKMKVWGYTGLSIAVGLLGINILAFSLVGIKSVTSMLIEGTSRAYSMGVPIDYFLSHILGVIAGGHIVAVPYWVAGGIALIGLILLYAAASLFLYRKANNPFSVIRSNLTSPSYWRAVDFRRFSRDQKSHFRK